MANLPADLPEDWTSNQKISPNGTEVGLSKQHGYNYLMKQVNDTQNEVNNIGTTIEAALEDVAKEASVQEVITSIGDTGDTGGSTVAGTVMAKLNNIQANTDGLNDNLAYLNSTIDSENPVALDVLMTQLLYGTTFEYSSPGTYQLLIPANVNRIKVTACGAGGGGAYRGNFGGCGGGGGGDAIVEQEYDVTPQTTLSITVGSGGAAGTSSSRNGSNGQATIIGNVVTLAGGYGGQYEEATPSSPQYSGTGGEAGGPGGGSGGRGWSTPYGSSQNNTAESGSSGITGSGGTGGSTGTKNQNSGRAMVAGGGGGGSLGNGGNGGGNSSNATRGTKGGGGGGGGYLNQSGSGRNLSPAEGGDGYAKIEFIITL